MVIVAAVQAVALVIDIVKRASVTLCRSKIPRETRSPRVSE
jgi:hypothetical protein